MRNSVGTDYQFLTGGVYKKDFFNAASFVCGWSRDWDKARYTEACWWDCYDCSSRNPLPELKKKQPKFEHLCT